jgi:hypothetical protein
VNASGAVSAGSFSTSGEVACGTLSATTTTINGQMTVNNTEILATGGTASSSSNYGSQALTLDGSYWNGSEAETDAWTMQAMMGTGSNPSSTLNISHSGSSGNATVSVPQLYAPTANATTVNATTGNITTVNGSTGNLTTVNASNVTASTCVQAGSFAGEGTATVTAGSTTVTGTSPSLAVYGSGLSGEIDFTVGSSPTASGVIATITFPTTYPSTPKAIIVANGTNSPTGLSWTTSTTGMTISCTSKMTAGTFYKLEYILMA